jgi:hypothetical protein
VEVIEVADPGLGPAVPIAVVVLVLVVVAVVSIVAFRRR